MQENASPHDDNSTDIISRLLSFQTTNYTSKSTVLLSEVQILDGFPACIYTLPICVYRRRKTFISKIPTLIGVDMKLILVFNNVYFLARCFLDIFRLSYILEIH